LVVVVVWLADRERVAVEGSQDLREQIEPVDACEVAVLDAVGEVCLLGAHLGAAGKALWDRMTGHRRVLLTSVVAACRGRDSSACRWTSRLRWHCDLGLHQNPWHCGRLA